MVTPKESALADILTREKSGLVGEWVALQIAAVTLRADLISEAELREQSATLIDRIATAVRSGDLADISGDAWAPVRELLGRISRSRAMQGFSPPETASFVLSLKQPVFTRMARALPGDVEAFATEVWRVTVLLDALALYTVDEYVRGREDVIRRQQTELLELSTPVVKMWDGILVLPLVGTLDSSRTQVIMETLLQALATTGSGIAIIDITGVPSVDTMVAQHVLKTMAAARLMGAECIVSGIRPQIAQTMVHLGVGFGDVVTKATLADALAHAFRAQGLAVIKPQRA